MNLEQLARALGITVSAGMTEAQLRQAIAAKLGLSVADARGTMRVRRLPRAAADADAPEAELLVYGDIGEWYGGLSVSAQDVVKQLKDLGPIKSLLVRINSYGGSVTDGTAIYNAIRATKAKITTRVEGVAASIASLIFMAGDVREMFSNTLLMVHAPWSFAMGNSAELRQMADVLDTYAKAMSTSYARATGRGAEQELEQLTDGQDHWFTSDQAKDQKYATAVLEAELPAEDNEADAKAFLPQRPVVGALTRYRSAPAAIAASFQPQIRAALTNTLTAAPAASPKESFMNLKYLARALGIRVNDSMTDEQLRRAITDKLKIKQDATDADIDAALTEYANSVAGGPAPPAVPGAQTQPAAPTRDQEIRAMFAVALEGRAASDTLRAELGTMQSCALISDRPVAEVRKDLLAKLTSGEPAAGSYLPSATAGETDREKNRAAAVAWLMVRAAVAKPDSAEAKSLGSNPFRGMSLHDLARACLENAGVVVRNMNRRDMIAAAITHSTSDFPKIFENALHKTLLAAYALAQPTWTRVCKVTSLSDFRPHLRYRGSHIGDLQVRLENGEFKTIALNDAEKESLQAKARGGIINISREMIVNDDMGAFTDLAGELGKAAARTREKALYALLALNGGLGPTMGDGKTLIHADHGNVSDDPGAPTMARIDADRQKMAKQTDPSGNDYLDIRPAIWLGPLSLGGTVRGINDSQYDPDATNKLQKPNIVRGLYAQVIDTPRLSGAPWFSLADPNAEPVIEMGFVDGQQEPQLATEDSFTQHGMKWRIVDEWGMGATGFRGVVRNAGA